MSNVVRWLWAVLVVNGALGGTPATSGLVNFGKVNDSLYRGGQPDALALKQLQFIGIKSVVNLRMTNDVWEAEAAEARSYSMVYTNLPLNSLAAPTDAQMASVLAAIEKLPKPIFVHCQYGCDRTGTVIACYRVQRDHWSNTKALKEAETFGISPAEVEMRHYIEQFKGVVIPP